MNNSSFQANKGGNDGEVKVTSLLRAKDVASSGSAWAAPDLQAEIVRTSKEAFERVLNSARADVAQDLERLRQATLSQARQEGIALGTQQGYEAGYEQGYKEAKAMLDAEFELKSNELERERAGLKQVLVNEWQTLVLSLTQSLQQVETSLLQDVIWLSGQMAQRLVMAELTIAPDRVTALVHHVVENLPHIVYPLTIRLHPDDIKIIDMLSLTQEGRVDLHPDITLSRGECVVKSGYSEAVLRWQTQTSTVIDAALQLLLVSEQVVMNDA